MKRKRHIRTAVKSKNIKPPSHHKNVSATPPATPSKVRKEEVTEQKQPKKKSWFTRLKEAMSSKMATKKNQTSTPNPAKAPTIKITAQRYETGIDTLRRLIIEKGEIKFKEAVKAVHISEELGREWVSILEQKGLIRTTYPPFGDMLLLRPEEKENGESA